MTSSRSLLWNIGAGVGAVGLAAVLVAALLLYFEFNGINRYMRERSLQSETRLIAGGLTVTPNAVGLRDEVIGLLQRNGERFAILDADGKVQLGTPGVTAPLFHVSRRRDREFFSTYDGATTWYGVTRKLMFGARALWIQVASNSPEISFDSLIEEFIDHLAWIWIPFVLVMLVVNLLIIHRGLRPLRIASRAAEAVGPETTSKRLPSERMPIEVLPLVTAVNKAFDRLEAGYKAQRSFIADAAHELRTPLAVLKAHLGVLKDQTTTELERDVEGMERLVQQLLDLARLDVLQLRPGDQVDLSRLAVEVASHMAPLAIKSGRPIEVIGCEKPVLVHGAAEPLFRAFRNLIENALNHSPPGSTVTVTVGEDRSISVIDDGRGIAPERRKVIFERFWRGDQEGGQGAGLGLAIVARTVAAHGAVIEVDDAPGRGAQITIHFPPLAVLHT